MGSNNHASIEHSVAMAVKWYFRALIDNQSHIYIHCKRRLVNYIVHLWWKFVLQGNLIPIIRNEFDKISKV